ncbi:glycosyltransferase [Sphingobacterium sp. Mn56C]|uniref:glycosyltransferase n=1 Tax=Sphingobacterium sp. Mn56C TaxID=3395261 RepID=UPI003BCE6FE7
MPTTAPIVLFVYNRPRHTRKTLAALERAILAADSHVIIFSDGAKSASDVDNVNKVRALIAEPWHFQKVSIIERERNFGLAQNIISGVTQVIERYGQVIVLEDDLEISTYGLQYFNDALETYRTQEQVMEISGYMYPVKDADQLPEAFFFRVANSWGWATWDRAWKHFNPDIEALTKDFTKADIKRFTLDHSENFWKQVQQFKAGKINSWAIRWYLSIFNQQGLVLYPRQSMIQNMGTDGSGTHSDADTVYQVELANKALTAFPKELEENTAAYQAIQYFYKNRKGSLLERSIRYAKKRLKNIGM